MGRVLVIGAGGVSTVAVKKIAMNADVFTDIMVASRTKSKCDKIAADIKNVKVQTAQVDADNVQELVALFNAFKPDLVVNLALPYQDLHIMDACLEYGVSYLDTANYEPLDEAKYQYSWQWAYKDRFEKAGLTAILGCGFDPGVTGVYTAYAAKHHFDEIHYLTATQEITIRHSLPISIRKSISVRLLNVANISRMGNGRRPIR